MCSTFSYMSPERISGNSAYSFSADIWSFGLSITACALGRYPYDTTTASHSNSDSNGNNNSSNDGGPAKTAQTSAQEQPSYWSIVQAIQHREPPTLPSDSFSPQIRDFLAQCLAKVRGHRQTCNRVAQLLYVE